MGPILLSNAKLNDFIDEQATTENIPSFDLVWEWKVAITLLFSLKRVCTWKFFNIFYN